MAIKTTTANVLQHGHRRRVNKPVLVRGSQLSARYITGRRIKHERKLRKQQQKQQQERQQQEQSAASSATATPEPSTPPCESTSFQGMTAEKKEALQTILGRTLDDKDRSAADILATLYMTGLLDRKTPAASEASGASTPIHESDVEPSKVTLPSMQQTEVMLEVWRSECNGKSATATDSAPVAENMEASGAEPATALSSSPMTPALSSSSSSSAMASARSSFSIGSPVPQYAHVPSPSGPPPPPYDAWRKSIGVSHGEAAPLPSKSAQAPLPAPIPSKVTQSPFSTYEQNYFCSSRNSSTNRSNNNQDGPNGMPSPPQSPMDAGRPSEYSYKPAAPTLPTLPSLANLPTPPQSFSASMQPAPYHHQQAPYHSHSAYQPRYHPQYELPAPMPTHRRSIHGGAEDIATTVVTLPPPSIGSREPLTPVSPLTLPSAFGRRSTMPTMPTMPSVATMINGPYHHHQNSPRMAAKLDARRDRLSSSASSPATTKKAMPKPHCNVKYETAELDFIMYQRTTKNRAWDDVTASFNAALPRLRQYAEMDCARLGAAPGSTTPGGADKMDRYRARPERTTPGLQASYYRQRLALPLLDESGQLVFDDATNKQLFTEVMVRDDKSRKKLRRTMTGPTAVAPSSSAGPSSKVNPDDARVHLVLYFPERVTYYDYWFVSEEDKALARQRTYERNMQRHQRGLPSWHPGNDDPDSGILTRGKE